MRESMNFDVVIVGAGPAGLSAAIHYAQLCIKANKPYKICILEKGAEVGNHILSGAVFEPEVLNLLLPHWQQEGAPVETPVLRDQFQFLTPKHAFSLPVPPILRNTGNYIISLGLLCRWLKEQAEKLGIEIYPGFAASNIIYNTEGCVIGVQTDDKGLNKARKPKANYHAGIDLFAKQTLFAEGCRGSLSQQLIAKFELAKNTQPQTYGLGLKEIWEVDPQKHKTGTVLHTVGWPLDQHTYGGGFIYHWAKNWVSIGLIVGLDYENPYLSPFEEFQRFKHHPAIQPLLEGGRCISYGARAINEGGWQSIPKLTFPGGMLIGCSAGFVNVAKIKGSHNAMRSGMLAAQTLFESDFQQAAITELPAFGQKIANSAIQQELYPVRNIRPAFKKGLWAGLAYAALDLYLLKGKTPWTFYNHTDDTALKPANMSKPIVYPKPDGKISFDKMKALSFSHVYNEENQPCHLILKNPLRAVEVNWEQYRGPEQRYCPAGVYEYVDYSNHTSGKKLEIHASNCIHCKACDIKDPTQNIVWTTPEGGGGPNYSNM